MVNICSTMTSLGMMAFATHHVQMPFYGYTDVDKYLSLRLVSGLQLGLGLHKNYKVSIRLKVLLTRLTSHIYMQLYVER